MTYEQFLKELEEIEENIFNKTEPEIDFTLLNIVKYLLEQKEEKEKTEKELLLQREVDEVLDSIIERPDYYFDTKENNIEKLIEKKMTHNVLPKTKEDKFATHAETNIEAMTELFDKMISATKNTDLKFKLADCKSELKKANTRANKKKFRMKLRQSIKLTKLILEEEMSKEISK
jgi:hypothetical protein